MNHNRAVAACRLARVLRVAVLQIGDDVGGIAEEINEGSAGANYGWPTIEHGPTTDPRFRGPIHHYPTACIAGGAFAPGKLPWPSEYRGRYFFGDWCSGTIWSLRIEAGRGVDVRKEAAQVSRLTSFGEDAAGELYAVSGGGRIYRVVS